jgi:hypothetical protein
VIAADPPARFEMQTDSCTAGKLRTVPTSD